MDWGRLPHRIGLAVTAILVAVWGVTLAAAQNHHSWPWWLWLLPLIAAALAVGAMVLPVIPRRKRETLPPPKPADHQASTAMSIGDSSDVLIQDSTFVGYDRAIEGTNIKGLKALRNKIFRSRP